MVKKKRVDKDDDEKKAKETGAPKPMVDASTMRLPTDAISNILKGYESVTLPANAIGNMLKGYESIALPANMIGNMLKGYESVTLPADMISLEQDLEDKINGLRKEKRELMQEVEQKSEALKKKEIKIDELNQTIEHLVKKDEEISQQLKLQHLFHRVHKLAWEKLRDDVEFRKLLEQKTPCPTVIMAIDIRRSTELMLKSKTAESYQSFIIALCAQLKQIILDNYGVFDKFTGDGILAFFPNFYSGDDATYWAVKAADECHACFSKHYETNRSCFTTVLKDVGLSIGIDYGDSHLVNIQDWLTVIGTPVVYACRLSGGPAGRTLLNQQAYEVVSQKFGEYINFYESEIDIKNEGTILTYVATLSKKSYEPKLPDWLNAPSSAE